MVAVGEQREGQLPLRKSRSLALEDLAESQGIVCLRREAVKGPAALVFDCPRVSIHCGCLCFAFSPASARLPVTALTSWVPALACVLSWYFPLKSGGISLAPTVPHPSPLPPDTLPLQMAGALRAL